MSAQIAGSRCAQYVLGNLCCTDNQRIKVEPGHGVRYVVPCEIRKSNIEKFVNLYFRVDDIYRDSKLIVKINDEIIYESKKLKLTPGEMESVKIPKEKLLMGEISVLLEE